MCTLVQGGIDDDLEVLFVGCLPVEIEFQEQEVTQADRVLDSVSSPTYSHALLRLHAQHNKRAVHCCRWLR